MTETEPKQSTDNQAEKIGTFDFNQVEQDVLDLWAEKDIYAKIKKSLAGKKPFFFIQGPPYTSGRLHMGHAWNNSLKDMVLRYKRMKGLDVFDRAAYDMHGLPTARKVMAELKLKTKEEIEEYGVEKFINRCMEFSKENAELMNIDLWRMGVWMDYENACLPIDNSYIEGEWFLIKKAHEKGRLYEGLRTLCWCSSCQTAMAKHECNYKEVEEDSIFVKFPVAGKENEYVVIWTTTPWTICYNLAVMVHPDLPYVKAKVGDEIWILAKGLAAPVIQNFTEHKLEILDEFPGKDLEGLNYEHPWSKHIKYYGELKTKHPKVHTIILSSEYVNLSAGTGLVHCAPGCGPEDYEVGRRENVPPFNNLREDGIFPDTMGMFSGLQAKKDDKKFIEELDKEGILIASTKVEHDYAHCERCSSPVVFRTTKQWFFKVEDLKEQMKDANQKIKWVPKAGQNAFHSWLDNLRDNSITKQRFWGTPVPIWKCSDCGDYDVIGSALELKEKAGTVPDNLHKPWIDEVEISCKCGGFKKRLPDILDVWIDAGTLSWNILDYPKNKELFEKLYPADFILEAKEQIRGWFNLLHVASFLAFDKPCFKSVYMHGMLTDVEGVKMSKSIGNVISPYELIDKHGTDTMRNYLCETSAGEDISFSWDEAKLRHRNLIVLWNVHKYMIEMSRLNGFKPEGLDSIEIGDEEKYIISKVNSTIKKVSAYYETYKLDELIPLMTNLFLELSRTYIQLTRNKSSGSDAEKKTVFNTIYYCLMENVKIFSTVAPFVCEKIYQNLKTEFGLEQESVHMLEWPDADEKLIDSLLEEEFEIAKSTIQAILNTRERASLGVRWPIKEVIIESTKPEVKTAVEKLGELIKTQTNVKSIVVKEEFDKVKVGVKADYSKLGPEFGDKSPGIIAQLAMQSPESIMNKIEADGKFVVKVNAEPYEITKDHLMVTRDVPSNYVDTDFRGGFVYTDTTRNEELDGEGYARELMRRVQVLRKEAGLQKQDRITLFVKVATDLKNNIEKWKDQIKDKVGAEALTISDQDAAKDHKNKKEVKVKDYVMQIMFDKI
ncbi:isoleucine--tRNA ligase [Candidatus Woesearchaeota archaeon]|jgi:isoleucyl-tRNA synthetase|nr:isoleucine--tRNA ligase [Candidatus Woesearchaeota archaeon]MBT6519101.1 isoleucine--tRNA ligase [Candidatus Woesearchaeota archaeon]MBT7367315.1 isoleucine--tRNA ligase [Candidatus Woesearchaeota archaeon]